MKPNRKTSKLALGRETVRHLSTEQLQDAAGGRTIPSDTIKTATLSDRCTKASKCAC